MNDSVYDSIIKFKWFSSLNRLKSENYNGEKNVDENNKKIANSKSVFYTIRRKIEKRFSTRKVASEQHNLNGSSNIENINSNNRIVLESANDSSNNKASSNSSNNEENEAQKHQSNNTLDIFGISDGETPEMMAIKKELSQYGWYWGNLNRTAAQKRLKGKPNGSFLVRNSQTEKNQFTLSFRSAGVTLHCRINLDEDKNWSYIEESKFASPVELILETMRRSETGVFGFVKQNSNLQPPFPVRLTHPVNRFYEVNSLQNICKYLIRSRISQNNRETIELLPLPNQLKDFLQSDNYDP